MSENRNSDFESRNSLKFIDELDDYQDHIVFSIVFVAGLIPICFLRLLLDVPAIFVSAWLVFLLACYAALIAKTRRYRLREDRAADNLYFLGFLFTVAALLVSLIKFSWTSDQSTLSNNPLTVVGDLGIGLITTLVGLFGRVFFTQLRKDPEEIEDRVRLNLSDAAERTRDQIVETIGLLEDSQDIIKQILSESRDRLIELNRTFETSISQLSDKVKNVNLPPDMITARLDPTLANAQKSLENFSDKTALVEVPSDMLTGQIKSSFDSLMLSFSQTLQLEIESLGIVAKEKLADEAKVVGKEAAVLIGNIEVPPDIIQQKLDPVIESLVAQFNTSTNQLITTTESFTDRVNKASLVFADIDENLASSTAFYRETFAKSIETIGTDLESIAKSFQDSIARAAQNVGVASDVYQKNAADAFNNFDSRLQGPVSSISASVSKVEESFGNLISVVSSAQAKIDDFSNSLNREAIVIAANEQATQINAQQLLDIEGKSMGTTLDSDDSAS